MEEYLDHSSPAEAEQIKKLEESLDLDQGDCARLIELGLLYHEPAHREEQSLQIFETLTKREPNSVWGLYWLCHLLIHHQMDVASLKKARNLLETWLSNNIGHGAIYQALWDVRQNLSDVTEEEKIKLLEESVRLEPAWVSNRFLLASSYEKQNRVSDAIKQLEIAQNNFIQADPSWDLNKRTVEEEVTGRTSSRYRKRILEKLRALRADK